MLKQLVIYILCLLAPDAPSRPVRPGSLACDLPLHGLYDLLHARKPDTYIPPLYQDARDVPTVIRQQKRKHRRPNQVASYTPFRTFAHPTTTTTTLPPLPIPHLRSWIDDLCQFLSPSPLNYYQKSPAKRPTFPHISSLSSPCISTSSTIHTTIPTHETALPLWESCLLH